MSVLERAEGTVDLSLEAVAPVSAGALRRSLVSDQMIDAALAQAGDSGVSITGREGLLNEIIRAVLERGLSVELDDHLGYEKGDPAGRGSANSRNGFTPKTLGTQVGDVPLTVPRDRQGTFSPVLVPKGVRRMDGLDEMIISLYAGGMTIRDIQYHLVSTLGMDLSAETISNITDAVAEEVLAWQTRPLDALYPVVFLDALVVKVKDGNAVRNKAAHIAIGVDCHGIRHVLGIWVQQTEGARFWGGVCAELANRGVRDVIIACTDGLTGFAEAIEATWPMTTVQTCTVHLIRASMRYVNYKDRREVAAQLKPVYTAVNEEAAMLALEAFAASDLGRKYPAAVAGRDAPIDVKWSSCCSVGVEPGVVAGGEFGVMDLSSLESGDGVDGPVEVLRDGLHRDAEGVPSGAQGGDVGGRFGVGQGVIDLACDVSLEAADDVALGQALGGSAGDVVHGGLVAAGHADQDDAVERGVRAPVSAAVDAVSGLLAT